MDSTLYRAMTAMLWLALPLTGLQYWSVWDRLPDRMATHFAASGQPNGWMSRESWLIFSIGLTVFLLLAFTWGLTRIRKPDVLAWSLLAMLYVVSGVLFSVNAAVLNFNLYGGPLNVVPPLFVVFRAAFFVMPSPLAPNPGPPSPRHPAFSSVI